MPEPVIFDGNREDHLDEEGFGRGNNNDQCFEGGSRDDL